MELLESIGSSVVALLCLATGGIFLIGGLLYWRTYGSGDNKR